MFAYCRNNPVSRVDASGTLDLECEDDTEDLTSGKMNEWTCGGNSSITTANVNSSNGHATITLFRAVSTSEAKSFSDTGQLSCAPGQMEGKFFATSEAHAHQWGQQLNADEIINIKVPRHALSHGSVLHFRSLDSIGPAVYFSDIAYLNSILIY